MTQCVARPEHEEVLFPASASQMNNSHFCVFVWVNDHLTDTFICSFYNSQGQRSKVEVRLVFSGNKTEIKSVDDPLPWDCAEEFGCTRLNRSSPPPPPCCSINYPHFTTTISALADELLPCSAALTEPCFFAFVSLNEAAGTEKCFIWTAAETETSYAAHYSFNSLTFTVPHCQLCQLCRHQRRPPAHFSTPLHLM